MDRRRTVRFGLRSSYPVKDALMYLKESDVASDVKCVQQMEDRSVHATFKSSTAAQVLLSLNSVTIDNAVVVLSEPGVVKKFVKVYYLPYEVEDGDLKEFLGDFGNVYDVRRDRHVEYPTLENGTRTVSMSIEGVIPSYAQICGFTVKIVHRGQKPTCRACGSVDHLFASCPSTKCYHCWKFGHLARNCVTVLVCNNCSGDHRSSRCKVQASSASGQAWGDLMDENDVILESNNEVVEEMEAVADSRKRKVFDEPAARVSTESTESAVPVAPDVPPVKKGKSKSTESVVPPSAEAPSTESFVDRLPSGKPTESVVPPSAGSSAEPAVAPSVKSLLMPFDQRVRRDSKVVYKKLMATVVGRRPGDPGFLGMYEQKRVAECVASFRILADIAVTETPCQKCGVSGHDSRWCPQLRCQVCAESGHLSTDCLLSPLIGDAFKAWKVVPVASAKPPVPQDNLSSVKESSSERIAQLDKPPSVKESSSELSSSEKIAPDKSPSAKESPSEKIGLTFEERIHRGASVVYKQVMSTLLGLKTGDVGFLNISDVNRVAQSVATFNVLGVTANPDTYCRNCRVHGHHYEYCPGIMCYNCEDMGHLRAQCLMSPSSCEAYKAWKGKFNIKLGVLK